MELSCVKPDPPAPLREANLLEVVRDAQCEIGCIEQVCLYCSCLQPV